VIMSLLHLSYQVIYVFLITYFLKEIIEVNLENQKRGCQSFRLLEKMNHSDWEQEEEITSVKVIKLGTHPFVHCNVG
jgi:hypothetical protein